jgi:hypothetical protein
MAFFKYKMPFSRRLRAAASFLWAIPGLGFRLYLIKFEHR